jgi:hypothetical protein
LSLVVKDCFWQVVNPLMQTHFTMLKQFKC